MNLNATATAEVAGTATSGAAAEAVSKTATHESKKATSAARSQVAAETRRAMPTNTPGPTEPPGTRLTKSLNSALAQKLREGNRDAPRLGDVTVTDDLVVQVQWAINDNLTEGMIKTGSRIDTFDILSTVSRVVPDAAEVSIVGTFSMSDAYGNAAEKPVVMATYSKETIQRINFDNILVRDTIWEIADSATISPAFQGD